MKNYVATTALEQQAIHLPVRSMLGSGKTDEGDVVWVLKNLELKGKWMLGASRET